MSLSNDLISQFVKATKDDNKTESEATVYGTAKEYNGSMYVQLDGTDPDLLTPVTTTANTKDGERVMVLIKNHTATITGNISKPSARAEDVDNIDEKIVAAEGEISDLKTDNLTVNDKLKAAEANILDLQANTIKVNEKIVAAEGEISNLKTDKLDASKAAITYATIESLQSTDAKITNLDATYAKVVDLNAVKADIKDLDADVANIDTLIFGSATGNTIQTSFSNAVIAQLGNAQIKSAMIESVSAGKITAGDIITNNVRVKSEDGSLIISDETMQISDENRVRVQIGKDASGDYSINIWDQNGNLMFSKGGITDSAIKNKIIRDDMVSDTANIAAHKLDIDSLFEEINGSTNTIKSTRVYLDEEGQSLTVAFKTLESGVSDLGTTVSSQGTQIKTIQGQIESKIWQQDIDTAKNSMSTQYSDVVQQVGKFQVTVGETYATKTALAQTDDNLALLTGDPTNYSCLNKDTAEQLGFTLDEDNWYVLNTLKRDTKISGLYECFGGEKVLIEYEYASSVQGVISSGSTETDYANVGIGLYCKKLATSGDYAWIVTGNAPSSKDAPVTAVSQVVTIPADARYFTVNFQLARWPAFSGDVKIRNIKVSKIDALVNQVKTNEITLNLTKEALESKASTTYVDGAVDAISIGGRNLVRDSKMSADTDLWEYDYNHHTISFENGYLEVSREYSADYTNRTFNNQYSSSNPLLMPDEITGKTYVLQAELKAIDGISPSSNSSIFWRVYYDNSANFDEITLFIPDDLSTTEWRRCYAVHTFGDRNWTNSQLTIAMANSNNGVCVRNLMLERASKASAWSPAVEDFDARVYAAETYINQNAKSITAVANRTSDNENALASLQLTADGLTAKVNNTKQQRYHETSGTSGRSGYVGICTIKVTGSYQNRPIIFGLNNRGQQDSIVSWCFANANNNDPGLLHIQCDGGMKVWAHKTDTSTWTLIVSKSESYDTIYVNEFTNTNSYVTVEWTSVHYDTLPTENITEYSRLAGKLLKTVVDDAAKTATNYLNFSSSGLVIGDMTAGTLGKNVLIDSDSVDIRNGTSTLASFGANTIYLGKNSSSAVINLCNGSATMRSVDDSDFKIYTDKRLVMSAYSSMLIDCWRDLTHQTRIAIQSADPDDISRWGSINAWVYQDSVENNFTMSNNTTELKITNGTNEAAINLNQTRFLVTGSNAQVNCTNGLYVGYDGDYKACITLGYDFLQDKRIRWYWSDGELHDAMVNGNGQLTYFGPGDIDEATTTTIRGQYVRLVAHSGGGVYLGSSGSTAITSDRNLKTDILDIDDKYMNFFDRLRPITYKYTEGHRDHVGFIAQEVEEALVASGLTTEEFAGLIIEHDVTLNPNYDSSMSEEEKRANETHYDTLYSLRYEEFISLLVKKVQSLQEQINQLRTTEET